ncbi:MAG: hypothetical protein NTV43_17525 [Methylococcales bacterium]|nr:hypothetical protein [Methylococcales bacterium]
MKHIHKLGAVFVLITWSSLFLNSNALATGRTEMVKFAKGTSSTTIKGQLKGDADIDYPVQASAGQKLAIVLTKSNPQNYFNVLPPGSETAMFVGQDGGDFQGVLPTDGVYTVRVYLMRPAARRNETSNYAIKVAVTGHALPALPATKDALIPGTVFHASANILCIPPFAPDLKPQTCDAFVIRRSFDGTATVEIHGNNAIKRRILFIKGIPSASDSTQALTYSHEADLNIVKFGSDERYEIPDVLIRGS